MAPKVYNEQGEKLCKGPLHKKPDGGGTYLNLIHFGTIRTGSRAGKPMYVCRRCWRIVQGVDPDKGWIPWDQVEPLYHRLMKFYESNVALCNDLGLNRTYFSRKREYCDAEIVAKMGSLIEEIEANPSNRGNGQGEAEVVPGEPLAAAIQKWVVEYLSERPVIARQGKWYNGVEFMGPMQLLAEKTEINVRKVSAIANGEIRFVPLSKADAILSAMHQNELLAPAGPIPVIPNPNWSMEKWNSYMAERGCR